MIEGVFLVSAGVCVCLILGLYKGGCYQSVHRKFKQASLIMALIDPLFTQDSDVVFV